MPSRRELDATGRCTAGASASANTAGSSASASGGKHDATSAGSYHKGRRRLRLPGACLRTNRPWIAIGAPEPLDWFSIGIQAASAAALCLTHNRNGITSR